MAISKKFFVDIDLQGNALTNSTVGANSSMTKAGSFQYNAAETRLEYFNGSIVERVANLADISAVTGGLIFKGGYDAATNTPNITDETALKGYFWVVTVAGTFLGESVQVGDSIIATIDEAGAFLNHWLILQGNVVIATDTVDGIVRLATQEQVNGGTETGAYAVTPATLQGKIDAQITPEINNKLPLAGGTMSGGIDMNGNDINGVNTITVNTSLYSPNDLIISTNTGRVWIPNSNLDLSENKVINLPAPTNSGDATNKTYVDGVGTTAEINANTYTDTEIAATRYSQDFYATDWVSENDYYKVTITHNLNTSYPVVQVLEPGRMVVEMSTQANDPNTVIIYSNFIPVDADNGYSVTIVK